MTLESDLNRLQAQLREQERRVRRRALVLTLIPMLLALGLIWLTGRQVNVARAELTVIRDSVGLLEAEAATRLEAVEAARRMNDSLEAQAARLQTWVRNRSPEAVTRITEQAAQDLAAEPVQARVYLHIVDESQRAAARGVQRTLEEAGFVVPGIERVAAGPSPSEVRYFRSAEREDAERIQQVVLSSSPTRLAIRDLSARYGTSSAIRPRTYEVWFSRDFPFAESDGRLAAEPDAG